MKHYIKCPYYKSHRNYTITCEDSIHYFSKNGLERQFARFCEDDWHSCKYVKTLEELYENTDPDKFKEEHLKLEVESLKKEVQKLVSKIGVLENQLKDNSEDAATNYKNYREDLEEKQKLMNAYASQTRWTESLAAAFLVTAYDLGTKVDVVEISKDEIATLMKAYKLMITMTEDGKAFRFKVERKENEHGRDKISEGV